MPLSADATDRVAAAVAAAEAAAANEEPPEALVKAFANEQARRVLVEKAALVGGADFEARFGENPQWFPQFVGR